MTLTLRSWNRPPYIRQTDKRETSLLTRGFHVCVGHTRNEWSPRWPGIPAQAASSTKNSGFLEKTRQRESTWACRGGRLEEDNPGR